MRKYLIAGVLTLICHVFLSSCSEDMGGNFDSIEEAKKAQFAQNFEKFYGKISPTQDWGFDDASVATSRALTRSIGENSCGTCIKPDMTNYPSANAPADITAQERAYVKNWFETHPGFTNGLNISNFYVQHVWGLASKPYKVWYNHYDQNYMNNHPGASSNYYRDDYYDSGTIDYLSVGDGTNYTHLNDFNANNAGTQWGTVYMENSSALSFKYHCSWSSEEFTYFKCAEIDVPGVGKGYYVGMCMYGEKYDNGDRKINKDSLDLQYADDWIIKVIPGKGSTVVNNKTTKVYRKKDVLVHKWVFCEDLGNSTSNRDYDYNDLVFDAKIIDEYKVLRDADGNETAYTDDPSHSYYAEVTPLAAGGELTIKFDKISNTAHGMFANGIAANVLINTCREDQSIAAPHQERLLAQTEKYEFASAADANINNIAVVVRTQTAAYALSAYKGEAPHKICVPVGTRWAYERTDIKDAYTGFEAFVSGGAEPWASTGVDANLYPLAGAAYDMQTDKTGTTSYEEIGSSSTTEYSYTLANAANEHVWWSDVSGNTKFASNWNVNISIPASDISAANVGNGTIVRLYFTCDQSYMLKVTDSTWDDFDLSNTGWNLNFMQGNAKNGYVEFKLNSTTANRFKQNGLILYGTNLTALAVTYDNSQKSTSGGGSTGAEQDLWTSGPVDFGWSNKVSLPVNAFQNKGVKAGSIIRFYMQSSATNYWSEEDDWSFTIFTGYESNWTMNDSEKTGSNTDISKGYFDYVLTADDAAVLSMEKNLGYTPRSSLQIQGSKFILNKITLIP